jgi:hypothetical protein
VKRSAIEDILRLSTPPINVTHSRELDTLLLRLGRLNRYEDRALARRYKAITAFDAARSRQLTSQTSSQNEAKNSIETKEATSSR